MPLHNLMESIVHDCLQSLKLNNDLLKKIDEKTENDIKAVALNRLPSRYVVSQKGEVIAKAQLHTQVESDVYRELSYAVRKVLETERELKLDDNE